MPLRRGRWHSRAAHLACTPHAHAHCSKGEDDEDEDLSNNQIVQLCRRFITFSDSYDGDKFWTVSNGARMATPLLLVLLVVELSDVVFAVDSIPAVFGVTLDPFIVYTSNIAAILSLRGLYGFVATFMTQLRFLDKAVALVLGFIGAKIPLDFAGNHRPRGARRAPPPPCLPTCLPALPGPALPKPRAQQRCAAP